MKDNQIMKLEFNDDQVKLIKSQLAPNATDNELKLFLYQAKRTGLDPLTRQIYCIHRGGKMTIQTSIDGFRVIAERSGDYAGQSEPVFTEENGKLISAKVSVFRFRNDIRYEAAVGVAYWSEYVQEYNGKPSTMWGKMPHTMLAKVAEALALRKAYPQDLSGLYTGDEMEQATDIQHEEVIQEKPPVSAYNHTTLGTATKPLISNKQFKDLCERVQNGDTKAYYAALEVFTFEATQKRLLETLFAALIDKEEVVNANA